MHSTWIVQNTYFDSSDILHEGGGRCWMYIAYPSFFLIQTHKVIKDGFKLV